MRSALDALRLCHGRARLGPVARRAGDHRCQPGGDRHGEGGRRPAAGRRILGGYGLEEIAQGEIEKVARGCHGLDFALLVEPAAQDLDRLGVRDHFGLLQGGLRILDHATAVVVVGIGTLDDLVEPRWASGMSCAALTQLSGAGGSALKISPSFSSSYLGIVVTKVKTQERRISSLHFDPQLGQAAGDAARDGA